MARTVRDANLETPTSRRRLKASPKPYFRSIDEGLHLGYRKGKTAGKWVLRFYVGQQDYRVETLDGVADDVQDADGATVLSFAQAQAKVRERFVELKREQAGLTGPATGPYTVKACIDEYLVWMEGNRKSAVDARYRADALILPELGETECAKLTTTALQKWLEATAKAPARLRTVKGKTQKHREAATDAEALRRRRATTNRTLTVLKAALNRAWRAGKIASDDAWRRIEPFEGADAARIRYLTIAEGKRLINAAGGAFRALVQAALATGARYGELATLNVSDFNPDSGTVHVRTSKSGKGRHIVLTNEGEQLFAALTAGREPEAPLLARNDGGRWGESHQSRPMALACVGARITPPASFHVLRHSYASLAIMNGVPLMIVAKNLGHADTRMCEKHYGHLAPSFVADAIRAGAPKFGFKSVGTEVTAISTKTKLKAAAHA